MADMSGDTGRGVDRRLILAIAVGMDALQARWAAAPTSYAPGSSRSVLRR